jgi:hypothetical protein
LRVPGRETLLGDLPDSVGHLVASEIQVAGLGALSINLSRLVDPVEADYRIHSFGTESMMSFAPNNLWSRGFKTVHETLLEMFR